eukprot:2903758-Prymnesium_polylepis.1
MARACESTDRTCGSKPRENMRSASSSTTPARKRAQGAGRYAVARAAAVSRGKGSPRVAPRAGAPRVAPWRAGGRGARGGVHVVRRRLRPPFLSLRSSSSRPGVATTTSAPALSS